MKRTFLIKIIVIVFVLAILVIGLVIGLMSYQDGKKDALGSSVKLKLKEVDKLMEITADKDPALKNSAMDSLVSLKDILDSTGQADLLKPTASEAAVRNQIPQPDELAK